MLGTSGPPRCSAASLPQGESALRADRRAQRTPFLVRRSMRSIRDPGVSAARPAPFAEGDSRPSRSHPGRLTKMRGGAPLGNHDDDGARGGVRRLTAATGAARSETGATRDTATGALPRAHARPPCGAAATARAIRAEACCARGSRRSFRCPSRRWWWRRCSRWRRSSRWPRCRWSHHLRRSRSRSLRPKSSRLRRCRSNRWATAPLISPWSVIGGG